MQPKGTVFDIKRYAIHDGPGIRTTVFLKGCPLRCPWCQNPEGIAREPQLIWRAERCIGCRDCLAACPQGAISFSDGELELDETLCDTCAQCVTVCHAQALELVGRNMTVSGVMEQVRKDTMFYDQSGGGVTFSGGEPLMQPDFLVSALRACKQNEIHTAVDTSGYVTPDVLAQITDDVDLFLWDLKIMDNERHKSFTGVSNEVILGNLKAISQLGKPSIVRFSLIPGVNDDEPNLMELGRFVASLGDEEEIDILPYHTAWVDKSRRLNRTRETFARRPPSAEMLERARDRLTRCGAKVQIGG